MTKVCSLREEDSERCSFLYNKNIILKALLSEEKEYLDLYRENDKEFSLFFMGLEFENKLTSSNVEFESNEITGTICDLTKVELTEEDKSIIMDNYFDYYTYSSIIKLSAGYFLSYNNIHDKKESLLLDVYNRNNLVLHKISIKDNDIYKIEEKRR